MGQTFYNIERLNILVVDDNTHMRQLVRGVLSAFGTKNILEASNGVDAIKELHHFSADVVICDWHMDPLNGVEFTKMMRTASDSPNPYVPILLLTGYTEHDRVVEARDAGINEFLAKPISALSLYKRICTIIEQPRPFIRTSGPLGYFGPSRRRKTMLMESHLERRRSEATVLLN